MGEKSQSLNFAESAAAAASRGVTHRQAVGLYRAMHVRALILGQRPLEPGLIRGLEEARERRAEGARAPHEHRDRPVARAAGSRGQPGGEIRDSVFVQRYSTRQILDQYDHLTPDDLQACLAYAREVIRSERVYAVKK